LVMFGYYACNCSNIGIWNEMSNQFIVTGKWWPELFEMELVERK